MEYYISGKVTRLGAIGGILCWIQKSDGVDILHPEIFFPVQIGILLSCVYASCIIFLQWNESYDIPRARLLLTMLDVIGMYLVALLKLDFGWLLILFLAVIDVYDLQKYRRFRC